MCPAGMYTQSVQQRTAVIKGCLTRYISGLPFPGFWFSLKTELSSKNATEEEILHAFYAVILDYVIHKAKAPVLDVSNFMGFEPRDPIAEEFP